MRPLLSIDEAAQVLGISKMTLYCWTSQRKIEFVKVGGKVKFRQESLEEWIEKNTQEAKTVHRLRIEKGMKQPKEIA